MLCDDCQKSHLGSISTGKSGNKFPAYQFNRDHKRVSYSKSAFEDIAWSFIDQLQFASKFVKRLKEILIDEWNKELETTPNETIILSNKINMMRVEVNDILSKIRSSNSELVQRGLEKEYEKLNLEITQFAYKYNNLENQELNLIEMLNWVAFFMEHPSKLLKETEDIEEMNMLFSLFFDGLPTIGELKNGTTQLAPFIGTKVGGERVLFPNGGDRNITVT